MITRWRAPLLAAVGILVMCGCSSPAPVSESVQTESAPQPTQTRPARPSPAPAPTGNPIPTEPNALFPDPSGDYVYVSTGGSDKTGELDWLSDDPLTFQFSAPLSFLGVSTPCNAAGGPYVVEGHTIRLTGGPNLGLMGCGTVRAERQEWAVAFISRPFTGSIDGSVLTLINELGMIELREI